MKINLQNISCSYGKLYLMFNMCTHIHNNNKYHTFIVILRKQKICNIKTMNNIRKKRKKMKRQFKLCLKKIAMDIVENLTFK